MYTGREMDVLKLEHLYGDNQKKEQPHSPLSWPMADWFMEECNMLSD